MSFKMLRVTLLTAACVTSLSAGANAAAFYLQEQSVSGLGTAFAGAAADTPDASTVYYNPAGMTNLTSPEIYAGASLLLPSADFDDTGSTYTAPAGLGGLTSAVTGNDSRNPFDPEVLPQLYGVLPINNRLVLGLGVNSSFGLADDYGSDFIGRYNSVDSKLLTIGIQPTAAYKVNNWLSVGAGVNVEYVYANLKSKIVAPTAGGASPDPDADGSLKLAGDDWAVGYNLGIQLQPTTTTKVGLTYKTSVNHKLKGDVDITNPTSGLPIPGFVSGAVSSASGTAKLSLPDIASFAVSQQLNDQWTVLGSVNWYGWGDFDNIPASSSALPGGGSLTEQNYENTWGFAVGARYRLNEKWLLKGGIQYDQTPTVTADRSTRIPDGDRIWFAGGVTYSINPKIDLDFSAAYVNVSEERVAVTDETATGTVVTRGDTDGSVGIAAAAIRYKF
ncbi:MAG: hypothetical protein DI551_03705 [Micavibrio aeruginosavorus]|uniref:Outer membrane transport family protein n=1 Tax=Micavibrio aeruginosavorus TaxID=349221 RepID=A0A2W5N2E0_9BACT|nr:MAG: hypothetical protein DI551_03705 [Micavibrio aeruginosavorus]